MSQSYRTAKLGISAATILLLTGCSMSGVNTASVEDRSISGNKPYQVIEQESQAQATAFTLRPSFKTSQQPVAQTNTQAEVQNKAQEVTGQVQKPATIALLNTATYQTNNGRLDAAQESLERALRISPQDPEVYLSLGEVHRRLGKYGQAEQMILKGISVAAGQSNKLRRLWSALAKIRSQAGDTVGANVAFKKSQSY